MNQTLKEAAQTILKNLVAQYTEPQRLMFKSLHSPYTSKTVNEIINDMGDSVLDQAITTAERIVRMNARKQ